MKVLHTKSATEPILLATTCHNMNLLAIITRSLVVVYRSTTLTVVTTLPLTLREEEKTVSACWSPSGRLLAIGLQCGDVYLLDVESGDLVRRFIPRGSIVLTGKATRPTVPLGEVPIVTTSTSNYINTSTSVAADNDNNNNNNMAGVSFSSEGKNRKKSNSKEKDDVDVDEDDNDNDDKEIDPLKKPPILPISVDGAIVACTWTSIKSRAAAMNRHKELCLPLRVTVSSPILEEIERENESTVLLLMDQKGSLCLLPGGIQEAAVIIISLPFLLDPIRMRVESFLVTMTSTLEKMNEPSSSNSNSSSSSINNNNGSNYPLNDCGNSEIIHAGYMVLQEINVSGTVPQNSSQVVRIPLMDVIAKVTSCETVTLCCIVEYYRMGKVSYLNARGRWSKLIQTVRNDLLLPQNVMLLRDALVEDITRPSTVDILAYFSKLQLTTLTNDMEEISRQFAELILQVSNVAYRCYDIALQLSQMHSSDRRRQYLLMDVIGAMRERCSHFMRQMRLEADHEKELLQWVIQRAALLNSKTPQSKETGFISHPPLRAVRHPSLLRSLHRIGRGKSTTLPLLDERNPYGKEDDERDDNDDQLEQIVQECLLGRSETFGSVVPLLDIEDVGPILKRYCEVLPIESVAIRDNIQVQAITLTQSEPIEPLMGLYAPVVGEDKRICLVAQKDIHMADMSPLPFTTAGNKLLWCGVVDEERHSVLLWEHSTVSLTGGGGSEHALVVVLVDENGAIELQSYDDDEEEEEEEEEKEKEENNNNNRVEGSTTAAVIGDKGIAQNKYAVLEIKGISTRHLRASVSRARGFGVFYAKERFVVVDFYVG